MAGLRRLPDWAILGAPKAGTTSLAAWLGQHPQAHLPPAKEVSYFDVHHARGASWYAQQFAGSDLRCGDATPAYLYSDAALDRLAAANPDVRLVVLLREPVDRMWSHYWYNRALGLDARSFPRAVRAERRDPGNTPYGLPVGYFTCSRYVDRLDAVTQRFAREQLLVLLFDDLRTDAAGVFARTCAHLGIDEIPLPDGGRARNVGRQPRSAVLQHALIRGRAGRWPLGLGPRLTRLNARPGGYPRLDPETAAELQEEFVEENARLAAWLGTPLPPAWSPVP